MFRILSTALAALLLATPLAASSQELPSYAQAPQGSPGDEQIRGRITSFDGAYFLTVSDERGFVDNVDLHQGTIINPTGITLAPGMIVSILGYNSGNDFSANEVDTPYSYDAGVPYYSGHPWDYYGPSVSLGFFFGNEGWWHGNDFRGAYSYNRGARSYNDVRINNVVNNNAYRGNNAYRSNNAYRNDNADLNRGAADVNRDAGSFHGSRAVSAPRVNVPAFDRNAAPIQTRNTQAAAPRNYEGGAHQGGNYEGGAARQGAGHPQSGGHAQGGSHSGGGDRGHTH